MCASIFFFPSRAPHLNNPNKVGTFKIQIKNQNKQNKYTAQLAAVAVGDVVAADLVVLVLELVRVRVRVVVVVVV